MVRFAAATPPLGGERGWPALPWLAGLLEAEGTFLAPPPSMPNCPIISCRMTDRDVIERVAFIFGRAIQAIDKGRHKTEYATTIKGVPAISLMKTLRPLLGDKRQSSIDRALGAYSPRETKLDAATAEEIRRRSAWGESKADLAREYQVSHHTIRSVIANRIYRQPLSGQWIQLSRQIGSACAGGTRLSWQELYWLAGWLEGEGSFSGPPPSKPVSARLFGQAADRSVIDEVGKLLKVAVQYSFSDRARARGWSPTWRVMLQGQRALLMMDAVEPLMGARRRAQIQAARALAELGAARVSREREDKVTMEAARFERACSVTNDRRLQV